MKQIIILLLIFSISCTSQPELIALKNTYTDCLVHREVHKYGRLASSPRTRDTLTVDGKRYELTLTSDISYSYNSDGRLQSEAINNPFNKYVKTYLYTSNKIITSSVFVNGRVINDTIPLNLSGYNARYEYDDGKLIGNATGSKENFFQNVWQAGNLVKTYFIPDAGFGIVAEEITYDTNIPAIPSIYIWNGKQSINSRKLSSIESTQQSALGKGVLMAKVYYKYEFDKSGKIIRVIQRNEPHNTYYLGGEGSRFSNNILTIEYKYTCK